MAQHLMKLRGGAQCGASVESEQTTPEINEVTCPTCFQEHEDLMELQERDEPELITGDGQWRAGKGAIVTAWHDSREDAIAEYHHLKAAGNIDR